MSASTTTNTNTDLKLEQLKAKAAIACAVINATANLDNVTKANHQDYIIKLIKKAQATLS